MSCRAPETPVATVKDDLDPEIAEDLEKT